jgi:hypothetical protein
MKLKVGQRVTIKSLEQLKKCDCPSEDYYRFAKLSGVIQRIENGFNCERYTIHMDNEKLNKSYRGNDGRHWNDNGWLWREDMLFCNINRRLDK